jgi:hypothetical protein
MWLGLPKGPSQPSASCMHSHMVVQKRISVTTLIAAKAGFLRLGTSQISDRAYPVISLRSTVRGRCLLRPSNSAPVLHRHRSQGDFVHPKYGPFFLKTSGIGYGLSGKSRLPPCVSSTGRGLLRILPFYYTCLSCTPRDNRGLNLEGASAPRV